MRYCLGMRKLLLLSLLFTFNGLAETVYSRVGLACGTPSYLIGYTILTTLPGTGGTDCTQGYASAVGEFITATYSTSIQVSNAKQLTPPQSFTGLITIGADVYPFIGSLTVEDVRNANALVSATWTITGDFGIGILVRKIRFHPVNQGRGRPASWQADDMGTSLVLN